ncbi:hypothetical protein OH77DRAFT_1392868 [Trametes cingulata]|nr:hypothetical protein OH77DRAFT_1392868 [Trametes cingulata]
MPSRISNKRNVELGDYHGNVLAGFYQYGTVTWKLFFRWLEHLFDTADSWIIVAGDRFASEQYFPSTAIVLPGKYTLLASGRPPSLIKLTAAHARRRQNTLHRAAKAGAQLNLHRARERDRKCMASGSELSWCRLQAAHIHSETHPAEHDSISSTSTTPASSTSGASRAAYLQNMLLLREDLHSAWADYEFGVDPDDDYRITAFVAGHDSVAGRSLQLHHLSVDPSTLPLDQLLRDHFLQGLLKHVKGRGERHWDFGCGALDLSDSRVWGTKEGKERLEVELENRLWEHRAKQNGSTDGDGEERARRSAAGTGAPVSVG